MGFLSPGTKQTVCNNEVSVFKKAGVRKAKWGLPVFNLEKVGPIFSRFNPSPSLPSVATDDRKQFQCLNIVFNDKTGSLLLEFDRYERSFSFLKIRQKA